MRALILACSLLLSAPDFLVAGEAETGSGPLPGPAKDKPTQDISVPMTENQIAAGLQENDFTRKCLAAFNLYRQPQLDSEKIVPPLYRGWCGAEKYDRPLFESCMRRIGKPMINHLLAEFKKVDLTQDFPNDSYIFDALGVFGPDVKSLAPQLAQSLSQKKIRNESILLLGRIGTASIPFAKRLVSSNDYIVSSDGLHVMEALGPVAASEWRLVMKTEMSQTDQIPFTGLRALGAMGPEARGALPWVMDCLNHQNPRTKAQALATLSRLSPNDRRAVDALKKQIHDASPEIRKAGLQLLREGSFAPELAESILTQAVKDADPSVRDAVIYSVHKMPEKPKLLYELVSPLGNEMTTKNNDQSAQRYIEVMSQCGPKGADWLATALSAHIGEIDNSKFKCMAFIPSLLRRMGTHAASVIPKLEAAIPLARYDYQKEDLRVTIFILRNADWPKETKR